jgi:CPA2 family monovalent cation:H+ antiporter-2
MGYGFFIPIFFIVTGVNLNLRTLFSNQQALLLIPIFLIAFIVSKAIVYFVFKPRFGHRLAMAASVLTATTITLVLPILEVGKSLKLISATQAGAITLAAIITCLVCPTLFNKIIDSKKAS